MTGEEKPLKKIRLRIWKVGRRKRRKKRMKRKKKLKQKNEKMNEIVATDDAKKK